LPATIPFSPSRRTADRGACAVARVRPRLEVPRTHPRNTLGNGARKPQPDITATPGTSGPPGTLGAEMTPATTENLPLPGTKSTGHRQPGRPLPSLRTHRPLPELVTPECPGVGHFT